jgi:hypothetical protein
VAAEQIALVQALPGATFALARTRDVTADLAHPVSHRLRQLIPSLVRVCGAAADAQFLDDGE